MLFPTPCRLKTSGSAYFGKSRAGWGRKRRSRGTYGSALVQGMPAVLGAGNAALMIYDGSDGAGHGVMLAASGVDPAIFDALQN